MLGQRLADSLDARQMLAYAILDIVFLPSYGFRLFNSRLDGLGEGSIEQWKVSIGGRSL